MILDATPTMYHALYLPGSRRAYCTSSSVHWTPIDVVGSRTLSTCSSAAVTYPCAILLLDESRSFDSDRVAMARTMYTMKMSRFEGKLSSWYTESRELR